MVSKSRVVQENGEGAKQSAKDPWNSRVAAVSEEEDGQEERGGEESLVRTAGKNDLSSTSKLQSQSCGCLA